MKRVIVIQIFINFLLVITISGCFSGGYGVRRASVFTSQFHQVSAGESLRSISLKYSKDVDEIARLNGIRQLESLQIGGLLFIGFRNVDVAILNEMSEKFESPNLLSMPVTSARISSRYGPRSGKFHEGIDFAAPIGTNIRSAHAGTVAYSGSTMRGYGNAIILRNKNYATLYAHCNKLFVRAGDSVKRGQLIAEVGNTGRSSGPHLHFEFQLKDSNNTYLPVNPEKYLKLSR